MKKRWLLVSLMICTLGFTGCTKMLPLTEEEEGMVAEFMAKELLESQEGYTQALIQPTEIPEPTQTTANNATPTAEPLQAVTPTVEPTVEPTKANSTDNISNQQANSDFAEVMGMSNIKVEYIGYDRKKSLTESSFNFEAEKGKELLIVKYNVTNNKKKALKFNLTDLNISYQLDINNGNMLKPLLTLKDNDLRFINLKINSKETMETVLMFAIDENLKIETANLIISKDNKTAITKLK